MEPGSVSARACQARGDRYLGTSGSERAGALSADCGADQSRRAGEEESTALPYALAVQRAQRDASLWPQAGQGGAGAAEQQESAETAAHQRAERTVAQVDDLAHQCARGAAQC